MVKALIYEYDGVICDSVDVKTEAFAELYRSFGHEIEEKVIAYHLTHGGVSRFEKFKYYHKEFLGIDLTEEEIYEWADRFSNIVFHRVIDADYIEGAYEFLKRNSSYLLQFICTGTPEKEIKRILKEKGIHRLFNKVCGAPATKRENTQLLLTEYDLRPEEVIFFGDAATDLDAASFLGIRFIGINSNQFSMDIEQYKNFLSLTADLFN